MCTGRYTTQHTLPPPLQYYQSMCWWVGVRTHYTYSWIKTRRRTVFTLQIEWVIGATGGYFRCSLEQNKIWLQLGHNLVYFTFIFIDLRNFNIKIISLVVYMNDPAEQLICLRNQLHNLCFLLNSDSCLIQRVALFLFERGYLLELVPEFILHSYIAFILLIYMTTSADVSADMSLYF